jgi:glycosyltransferase involved in cell wall biosynthesis
VKIALVAPLVSAIREPQLGGTQSFLADLAAGLAARGHRIHVFAAVGTEIPGAVVIDTGIHAETLRDSLYRAGASRPADGGPAARAFASVYGAVANGAYDLVHNHAFDAPAIRLAGRLSVPVVHTVHLPPEASVIAALREARTSPRPPTVAAVSESQAEGWRAVTAIDTVLPDGVPVRRIPWSASPGVGAVFAGRFSTEKGAADAIQIAGMAGLRIDLYGHPYDLAYARDCVYPHAAAPSVVLHAAVERTRLWQIMARAAVVLCPVKWDEPFGLVAAEAQAAGTPVVAFRRGGLAEVVVDGVTGFLIAPDDIPAAAQAARDAARIARAACRKHAEARLDLDASLDAHEALYRRAITPVPEVSRRG